jgi:hypothetical protein
LGQVLGDAQTRAAMRERVARHDFTQGKRRVIERMEALMKVQR